MQGVEAPERFKFIKSLLGIETKLTISNNLTTKGFKFIKSLLGIETVSDLESIKDFDWVSNS